MILGGTTVDGVVIAPLDDRGAVALVDGIDDDAVEPIVGGCDIADECGGILVCDGCVEAALLSPLLRGIDPPCVTDVSIKTEELKKNCFYFICMFLTQNIKFKLKSTL